MMLVKARSGIDVEAFQRGKTAGKAQTEVTVIKELNSNLLRWNGDGGRRPSGKGQE